MKAERRVADKSLQPIILHTGIFSVIVVWYVCDGGQSEDIIPMGMFSMWALPKEAAK